MIVLEITCNNFSGWEGGLGIENLELSFLVGFGSANCGNVAEAAQEIRDH